MDKNDKLKKYHFITGLPRSGSTLLSAILKQNPRFHASITDPLATMFRGVIETSQDGPGMKYEVPIERRINTIKGLFDGFHQHINKEVIFNTNRVWTLLTPQLDAIYPNARLIVCVRSISWIIDSFEMAHRNEPLSTNTVTGGMNGTVYSRAEGLMTNDGIVGFPLLGIRQALAGNERHKLFLLDYDSFCQAPELVMQSLYAFIDEPFFQHDFNNVEGNWEEYDKEIGIPLHRVGRKVQYRPRKFIIPQDIVQQYSNLDAWK